MERCAKLIKMINNEIKKQANNQLASHELTIIQIDVLILLNNATNKTMSMKELEKELHTAQSTCNNIVKRLAQKKFVETFLDSNDKRVKNVHLTSIGESNLQLAESSMNEAENKLLSPLNPDEQKKFHSFLVRIYDNLK